MKRLPVLTALIVLIGADKIFCQLPWPIPEFDQTYLSSAYGPRDQTSLGYDYDDHRGFDIAAPTGTQVIAIANGFIVNIFNSGTLDETIVTRSDLAEIIRYSYMQNSSFYLSLNQRLGIDPVSELEIICEVGGSHLDLKYMLDDTNKDNPYYDVHPAFFWYRFGRFQTTFDPILVVNRKVLNEGNEYYVECKYQVDGDLLNINEVRVLFAGQSSQGGLFNESTAPMGGHNASIVNYSTRFNFGDYRNANDYLFISDNNDDGIEKNTLGQNILKIIPKDFSRFDFRNEVTFRFYLNSTVLQSASRLDITFQVETSENEIFYQTEIDIDRPTSICNFPPCGVSGTPEPTNNLIFFATPNMNDMSIDLTWHQSGFTNQPDFYHVLRREIGLPNTAGKRALLNSI